MQFLSLCERMAAYPGVMHYRLQSGDLTFELSEHLDVPEQEQYTTRIPEHLKNVPTVEARPAIISVHQDYVASPNTGFPAVFEIAQGGDHGV